MTSTTRAVQIAAELRMAILEGEFYAGQRLVELHLAHGYGVSQALIREALHLLELEGWVRKRERHGVYVRLFLPAEVAELGRLAAAVETELLRPWAVRPAVQLEKETAALRLHVLAARRAQGSHPSSVVAHLLDVHEHLAAPASISGDVLRTLINGLRLGDRHHQIQAPRPVIRLDADIQRHDAALSALRSGDPTALPGALRALTALED